MTSLPECPARRPKVPGVLPGGSVEDPAKGPALSAGVISQGFSQVLGAAAGRSDLPTHAAEHEAMGICQPNVVLG